MTQTQEPTPAVTRWHPYPAYKASGIAWLGEIPAHWEVKRLKYAARLIYGDALPNEKREIGDVKVFGSNGIVGTHTNANTLAPAIIIGRKGSYGKVNYTEEQSFVIDTAFYIDNRSSKTHMRWLFYVLPLLELDSASEDSAIPGLSRESAYAKWLPCPPLPEQQAIAAFLDHETERINTLIASKQRLIALLQEQRAAIISRAVTRGLDATVPLKASCVAWLGEIPAHWEVLQLRRIVTDFVDYRGFTPTKTPSGIPLITARNIKNGVIDLTLSQEFISEEDYPRRMVRGFPEIGDVLITTEAPLGEAAQIVDEKIALAQRIILLKLDKSQITNEYLKYYFISLAGQGELWSRATGSTAVGIKASHLREILITIPPLSEQLAIVQLIKEETAKIDALISTIQAGIKKVQEYGAALVSAAVTGKIDVRKAGRHGHFGTQP